MITDNELKGLTALERFAYINRNVQLHVLARQIDRTEHVIYAAYNRACNKITATRKAQDSLVIQGWREQAARALSGGVQ